MSTFLRQWTDKFISDPEFFSSIEAMNPSTATCLQCDAPIENKTTYGLMEHATCCDRCWTQLARDDKYTAPVVYLGKFLRESSRARAILEKEQAIERSRKLKEQNAWERDAQERKVRGDQAAQVATQQRREQAMQRQATTQQEVTMHVESGPDDPPVRGLVPSNAAAQAFEVAGCRRRIWNRPGRLQWMSPEQSNSLRGGGEKETERADQGLPLVFVCRTQDLIGDAIQPLSALLEALPGIPRDETSRGEMLVDRIDPNAFPLDSQTFEAVALQSSETKKDSSARRERALDENATEDDDLFRLSTLLQRPSSPRFRYLWVPSDVSVRAGKAYFTSEIPGVREGSHIVPLLELALTRMLPMFQCLLDAAILPNSDLQVIVKCQSYQMPGQATYTGEFHREGPPQENIVGVGLLYVNVDARLQGGNLDFKIVVDRGCGGTNVDEWSTDTRSGVAVVFRNDRVYHRMGALSHPSPDSDPPASRTVLAFFPC